MAFKDPAKIPAASVEPATGAFGRDPDLLLQVMSDEGDSLAVEVIRGAGPARGSVLRLGGRGVFEVVTAMKRGVTDTRGGIARVLLRLRQVPARAVA